MGTPEGARVPMRRMRWAVDVWPGGTHLWMRGSWLGLATAVVFTVLLGVVLAATLVWTEWFEGHVQTGLWTALASIWIVAAVVGRRARKKDLATHGGQSDPSEPAGHLQGSSGQDLFREAQAQYLKGNWFEAELLLGKILQADRHDADALLMLVTLWRHTGRQDEAAAGLTRLECLEGAQKWEQEISTERARLSAAENEAAAA